AWPPPCILWADAKAMVANNAAVLARSLFLITVPRLWSPCADCTAWRENEGTRLAVPNLKRAALAHQKLALHERKFSLAWRQPVMDRTKIGSRPGGAAHNLVPHMRDDCGADRGVRRTARSNGSNRTAR